MLVSIALNAILLGIIGEYVARMYSQVRPQPLTIVERVVDRAEPPACGTDHHAVQPVDDIVLPAADARRRDRTKASSDEALTVKARATLVEIMRHDRWQRG